MADSRRWPFWMLVLLLAALVGAGCGDDDDDGSGNADSAQASDQADKEPIVIGLTGSHSGFMSSFDPAAETALKIAVDEVNAAGGIDGRQVETIAADSKSDPVQSATAAEQMISDGADFLVTSCDYDVGGPAARVAQENGLLAVSLCAGSPKWNAIGPNAYSMALGSETEGAAVAQWGYEKGGCESAYLLTDTFIDYTKVVGDVITELYEGDLVGTDTFKNGDQSFAGQVSRVQAASPTPDCIFLSSVPPGGVTLLRQLRSAGIDQPVVGPEGMGGDFWLDAVPGLSDFYYAGAGSLFGDDPDEKVNELAAKAEKQLGKRLTSATFVSGYSVLQAIKLGVERAGTTDTDAVVEEFQSFDDEDFLIGPTSYSETDRRSIGRPVRMIEIQDGKASFLEMFEPKGL